MSVTNFILFIIFVYIILQVSLFSLIFLSSRLKRITLQQHDWNLDTYNKNKIVFFFFTEQVIPTLVFLTWHYLLRLPPFPIPWPSCT